MNKLVKYKKFSEFCLSKQKLMQEELKNIATISSGQTFRGRIENDRDGAVWVIQMKNLDDSYTSLMDVPHLVKEDEVSEKQLLEKGDILFLAKGNNNKAFVFNENHPAVAVSLFFVMRPDKSKVIPEYLAWFLNNKNTQSKLHSMRAGAMVSNIKKPALESLKITLPSIKFQKLIAKIYKLSLKEQQLLLQLAMERENYVQSSLTSISQ